MDRRPRRTKKRKCGYALLMLIVLVVLFRHSIARHATIQIGSRVVGAQVEIDAIRIGLKKIDLAGIRLFEPGSQIIQAEVRQVSIDLTPWEGIRNGIWARRIVVNQPTLHARFDHEGKLLTQFPTGEGAESGGSIIPISRLHVRDATLVVHQTGKDKFAVKNAKLIASFAEEIRLQCDVPDLLGGAIQLQAIVNPVTLEGRSRFTADNVTIDSGQLAKLPLVPSSVHDEPAAATLSLNMTAHHPAGEMDLRRHEIELLVDVHDVQTHRLGKLCNDLSIMSVNRAGKFVVQARGDLAGGNIGLSGDADLLVSPVSCNASFWTEQLDVGRLCSSLLPGIDIGSKIVLLAQAKIEGDTHTASFSSSLRVQSTENEAENIKLADVTGEVRASGRLAWRDFQSLTGDIDGSMRSDGTSVADIAKRLHLPASAGSVTLASDFHVSLAEITSPNAYTINASVSTSDVAVGEFQLLDTTARLTVKDGLAIAELNDASVVDSQASQIASCSTSVRVPLVMTESIAAAARLSLTPTSSLTRLVGLAGQECGGTIVAAGSASCALNQLAEPKSWKAHASLKTEKLAIAGETIGDVDASLDLCDEVLTVPPFPLRWRENQCTLRATGTINDPLAISGNITGDQLRVADIADVISRFSSTPLPASGIANVDGKFHLTAAPFGFAASGSASLGNASYAGSNVGEANLTWIADLRGVQLKSSSSHFLGGTFDLVANARELDWTKTVLEGRFQDIQAARIAALIDRKLPISGSLDGGFSVTTIASLETVAGQAWLNSRGLNVHRIPVEISSANISLASSAIIAKCEGTIADGRYQGIAKSDLNQLISFAQTPDANIARIPVVMQARLENLPIESLASRVQLPKTIRDLGGNFNATCVREAAMLDGSSLCTATAWLNDLQINRVRLSDRITGDVTLFGDRVELRRIDGRFADGRLSGKAMVRLAANPTGTFDFSATRVNMRRASAPFVSQPIAGSGTVQIRGRIGQVITGRADVSLRHGLFSGLTIADAKFPIDWSYSQPSRVSRWQCRAGVVSTGGGTVRVSSEGSLGTSMNMTTSARIDHVDSSKLLRGKSVGAGIVSGTMTMQAKRARSPKQFSGKFDITLENVKSLEIPVLDQLPKLVSLTPAKPGQGQNGGAVRGRIAGGLVHVDQLAIAQSNVQVLMSGNATLDGRLNFDVTVSTQADGPADQLLSLADSPLMLAAPAPIALVAKANDLMKERVVHVHVGGIASRPSLRLQPGKQLSQDAVQFFLKNSFGSTAAEIATRSSQPTRR